jgi:hypothetical protein
MNARRIENAHVAFWLLKDFSWCTSTRWLGLLMIAPTLALAIRLAYHTRDNAEDCVHNVATCFWIGANIIWMIGEFFYDDHTRGYAQVSFWAGLTTLAIYYVYAAGSRWLAWLREPS